MDNNSEQPHSTTRQGSILFVLHDLKEALRFMIAVLQETPYEAFLASERFEALNYLKFLTPVLFIFDYQLVGMKGIELYDLLHAVKEFKAIPTIILTTDLSRQEPEIIERKLVSLNKPLQNAELITCISRVLA